MSEAMSESSRHLAALDRHDRRLTGVVYTPHAVVDLVLDQEFGTGAGPVGPVLDAACGAGHFTTALVARIAAEHSRRGEQIESGPGRRRLLGDIERLVWACDIDPEAVDIARAEVRALIECLAPGPLSADFMAQNIVVGNFLMNGAPPLPGGYQHVIGNPPYVPVDRLGAKELADYRQKYASAVGRVDLYYLFMEEAARALREGGSWTLITPDKFLSNQTARTLRRFLADEGSIRALTRFTSHSIFHDAAIVPCVTTWLKGQTVEAEQARVGITADDAITVIPEVRIPSRAFQQPTWTFHPPRIGALLAAIVADHPRLADHADRISAGPATGFNPAFIVDARTAARLDEELVHPTVRGRDVGRFSISDAGSHMLVPYVWSGDEPSLIDLDEFPRTRRWLAKHRAALRARHAVKAWGKAWWDLHDPVKVPLHRTTKILVPDVARENRFAVDEGRFIPQHSAYYLTSKSLDPYVLTAILNSAPVELAVRSAAPLVKDGFSRYRRQYLLDLPCPDVSPSLAARIRDAAMSDSPEAAADMAATLFDVDLDDVRTALDLLSR